MSYYSHILFISTLSCSILKAIQREYNNTCYGQLSALIIVFMAYIRAERDDMIVDIEVNSE